MTAELTNPIFTNETKAREYLQSVRWPRGPICPHCGSVENITALNGKSHRAGLHQCNSCREHFTVTVGTLYERSHIPLHKWLYATHLMSASKKGVSAHQLHRMFGITYKSAWFMAHRIRAAMTPSGSGKLGGGGIVEADETFVGCKPGTKVRRGYAHKEAVFALVERGGAIRSFHVPDVTADTLKAKLKQNVAKSARVMTDDAGQYTGLGKTYLDHQTVNHSAKEYVRGDTHTNTIEGAFSIFKRGMYGV
jgi:transposase-like protein